MKRNEAKAIKIAMGELYRMSKPALKIQSQKQA
jgi:hypothetical protein